MRVLVTGTDVRLGERLRAAGFDIVESPLIRIEPVGGAVIRAEGYDWLILTSRHGAEHLFERLEGPIPKVAVIGPGTADALRQRGIEPALVATVSTQEGLITELPRQPGRVLFAGAEGARDTLVRELEGDLAVIASASAARALAASGASMPCVSIGPVTSGEARRHGLDVVAEAASHDLEGLVQAVKLAASQAASSPS
jgi:uroporphyrinogen-III synthase